MKASTESLVYLQEFFNELANASRRKFLDIQAELERREKAEGYDWREDAQKSFTFAIEAKRGVLAELEYHGAPR